MTHDEIMSTPGQHQSSMSLRRRIKEGSRCVHLEVGGEGGDASYSIVEFASGAAAIFTNGDPEYYGDLEEAQAAAANAAN